MNTCKHFAFIICIVNRTIIRETKSMCGKRFVIVNLFSMLKHWTLHYVRIGIAIYKHINRRKAKSTILIFNAKYLIFFTLSSSSFVSQPFFALVIARKKTSLPQQELSTLDFLLTPTALLIKKAMWYGVNAWFIYNLPTYLLKVVKSKFNKSCPAVLLSFI